MPPSSAALTDPQRTELEQGSRISAELIEAAGLYSLDDPKACTKMFGWSAKRWEGHTPCLVFPYRVPGQRDPVLYRGKPAVPLESKGREGEVRTAKYVSPKGAGVHLYFTPGLLGDEEARASVKVPLLVTEGEKKALAADTAGFACVGITGVTQWREKGSRRLHSEFAHLNLEGREVFVCFDRDALSNKDVRKQELLLGETLARAGAHAFVVRFPEGEDKLDDFLVARGPEALRELLSDARKGGQVTPSTKDAEGAPAPGTATTDLGNAERFIAQHGQDLRYCRPLQAWYVWTGQRWRMDTTGVVVRRAVRTARSIYKEASEIADTDARAAMERHAERSESRRSIDNMVALAASFGRVVVEPEAFDADPWLLNVANGTLDLRTGELCPHKRENLITKISPIEYDPDATHERWEAFLEHASDGEDDFAHFLQVCAGYSLTGDTSEDKVILLYGEGGRGKSTFVAALESVMGDYARTAAAEAFLKEKGGGGDRPRPDLVRLRGSRLVACKEIDQGAHFAEATVKTVTGGDVIAVRGLRQDYIEFRPTFKLWIVANDAPHARADDTGIWRRILRIPFDRAVAKPDRGLRAALTGDRAVQRAVLAWAVRGVALWREEGLQPPQRVVESTRAYRSDNDPFAEFFDLECTFERDARVSRKELREAYEQWCRDEGLAPLHPRAFANALRSRLLASGGDPDAKTTVRTFNGAPSRAWVGVRLADASERVGRMNGLVVVKDSDRRHEETTSEDAGTTEESGHVVTSRQIESAISRDARTHDAGAHARTRSLNYIDDYSNYSNYKDTEGAETTPETLGSHQLKSGPDQSTTVTTAHEGGSEETAGPVPDGESF